MPHSDEPTSKGNANTRSPIVVFAVGSMRNANALRYTDKRLLGAIAEYEQGLLSLLNGLRPRPS